MKKNTKKKSSEVKFVSKELKKVSNASDDYKKFINLIIVLVVMAVLFVGLYLWHLSIFSSQVFFYICNCVCCIISSSNSSEFKI